MSQDQLDFIKSTLNRPNAEFTLHKLFGQASARQYFRVTEKDSDEAPYILMDLPDGFSSPAEEITKVASSAPQEFPFLNVQKYLHELELYVPTVYGYDANQGYILLQDLGDQSFEELIKNADGGFKLLYYKKAIDELIRLQQQTQKNVSKDCVAYHREFDQELLSLELIHFLEYGIEDRFGIKLSDNDTKDFTTISSDIAKAIQNMPQGFVHRDFQSRNIMFHEFQFYLIDFQDALQGPVLYDLVALLRDSYISISNDELNVLISYYVSKLPSSHPYHNKLNQAFCDFHLIALQRKLKDTGRFQYIKTVRNNPDFLVHVPQSLEYIKGSFDFFSNNPSCDQLPVELSQIQKLKDIITPHIKEWQ